MFRRPYTIVRGGRLIDSKRVAAERCDILIKGDTIVEIGPPGFAVAEDAAEIDAHDRLLHPGLICAHTHGHCTFGKGQGDRWTLELLQTAGPWLGSGFTLEERYLVTYVGAIEMLLKGCTACYDMTLEFPAPTVEGLTTAGRAYYDAGMRAVVAPMVAEYSLFEAIPGLIEAFPEAQRSQLERFRLAPIETTLKGIRDALQAWPFDRAYVRPSVAPTIPHHCSDEFMVGCHALARDYDVGVQSHIQESKLHIIVSLKKYGMTQVAHLERLGLLGPHFTAAHAVWLDDDDMRRLADHGCCIAHNPGSNMRLGNGLPDTRRMLDHGLTIGIGTDGAHCTDNLNMYEAMRVASYASRVQGPDMDRGLTTGEILKAATEGSARALGFGDVLGNIAPGFKADIVFLRLDHVNWMPFNNATNQLVHTEDGSAIDSVMVGGRMVVEDRAVKGVDMAALARRVESARVRLAEANTATRRLCEHLATVVNVFCPNLARTPYHINRFGACEH